VVLLGTYRGTKVALKRAIKLGSKGSKHSVSRRSRGGSRGSGRGNRSADRNTDSVGLSSTNSGASNRESDPEAGGESDSENLSYDESNQTGSTPGRESRNASRSRGSKGPNSLGFLAEDFGRPTQWGWLFPWAKKNTFDNRFKEAILGSSNVSAGKSWHAALCPWFNAQVRAEAEFIQEMRILSRLRHPSITTVLGAVTSHNHDPMLVSKCKRPTCRRQILVPMEKSHVFFALRRLQWNIWNTARCTISSAMKPCISRGTCIQIAHGRVSCKNGDSYFRLTVRNSSSVTKRDYSPSMSRCRPRPSISSFIKASNPAWRYEVSQYSHRFALPREALVRSNLGRLC
jgi:hypothetical protein